MTDEDRTFLAREAACIHEQFFGGPAPPEVIARYVEAHSIYLAEADERGRRVMQTVLERGLDLEAVELALRARRYDRSVTTKIQVLFYLVEVRSRYYGCFVNTAPGRVGAWWNLGKAVLKTAVKYLKGVWLVHKYGL